MHFKMVDESQTPVHFYDDGISAVFLHPLKA